jgi:hypothetical protein
MGATVFTRSSTGWVGSHARYARVDSIKGLAVRDGMLYAVYSVVKNGVEVGIITGQVTVER